MTSEQLAGRRLITLLFDVSSMQPEDVQRAVDSAHEVRRREDERRRPGRGRDVGSTLDVLTDFTADRAQGGDGARPRSATPKAPPTPPPTRAPRPPTKRPPPPTTPRRDTAELDMFNNDVRLRALKTLAETLAPIEQKKAILYFSAGMQRSGQDNQVELRSAINAAVRAQRGDLPGRHARAAGGRPRRRRAAGQRPRQRAVLRAAASRSSSHSSRASQDTLTSLAADTGGRAFTDTNDFGEAFARVQRDMSAYYLLGYSSTQPDEGRPLPPHPGPREARGPAGRGARRLLRGPRLRAHEPRRSRDAAPGAAVLGGLGDRPAGAGHRRLVPRWRPTGTTCRSRSRCRAPPCRSPTRRTRCRSTCSAWSATSRDGPSAASARRCKLPPGTGKTLAGKQVLYQSGVTLPPGRFSVKVGRAREHHRA